MVNEKMLSNIYALLEKKGCELLDSKQLESSFLAVVLVHNKQTNEFIVWTYNDEYKGFFGGSYHAEESNARETFKKKN